MKNFIILLFFTFLVSCTASKDTEKQEHFSTFQLSPSIEKIMDTETGIVESKEKILISSQITGTLESISKKIGDTVKKGEIIAEIKNNHTSNASDIQKDILSQLLDLRQNSIDMYDLQISALKKTKLQSKKQETISQLEAIQALQNAVDSQKSNQLEIETLLSQEETINKSIIQLIQEEKNIKNIYQTQIQNIEKNRENALIMADTLIKNILETNDQIYGFTEKNKTKNDQFEIYISAEDPKLKTQFEHLGREIIENYNSYSPGENTQENAQKYYIFLQTSFSNFLQQEYKVLTSSIESASFPITQLNSLKEKNIENQKQIQTAILSPIGNYLTGVKGSLDTFDQTQSQFQKDITSIQNTIQIKTQELQTIKTKIEKAKIELQNHLDIQNTLAKIKEENQNSIVLNSEQINDQIMSLEAQKKSKISEIDSQISQARQKDTSLKIELYDGKIISNIDGVITKKYVNIYENVQIGNPLFEIATSQEKIVSTHISGNKGKPLQIKQKVQFIYNNLSFTGEIIEISPEKESTSKTQKIKISPDKELPLLPGEQVEILLNTQDIYGFWIKDKYLLQKYQSFGVEIESNGKRDFFPVKVIQSHNGKSLIEGLDQTINILK